MVTRTRLGVAFIRTLPLVFLSAPVFLSCTLILTFAYLWRRTWTGSPELVGTRVTGLWSVGQSQEIRMFDDRCLRSVYMKCDIGYTSRQWTMSSLLFLRYSDSHTCPRTRTPTRLHADINKRSIAFPIISETNVYDVKPDIFRVTLRRGGGGGGTPPNKWLQSAEVLPPPVDSPGNSLINIWVTRANSHCQGLRVYRSDATMDTVRYASDGPVRNKNNNAPELSHTIFIYLFIYLSRLSLDETILEGFVVDRVAVREVFLRLFRVFP